jgi:predicted patatin/cPLA2 family phospholipase
MKKNLRRFVKYKNLLNKKFFFECFIQELRYEDYIDNRKFSTTTTNLFPSASSTQSLFGGTTPNRNFNKKNFVCVQY